MIDDGASGIWTPTGLSGCVCLNLLASDYSHDSRSDYPLIFGAIGSRGKIKLTDFGDCSRIIGDDNSVYARRLCGRKSREGFTRRRRCGVVVVAAASPPPLRCRRGVVADRRRGVVANRRRGVVANRRRVVGSLRRPAQGLDGDDAMLTVGDSNRVTGGDGNDVMSSAGDGNSLYADAGDDLLTAEGSGGHINGGRGEDICTDLGDNTFFNEVYDDDPGAYQDCESCSGPDGAILECETGEPY